MKRRVFLKKTLLAAPAVLASASLISSCGKDFNKPGAGKKVVVVGAGIAGIYAAQTLLTNGFEVVVLEASERWGGRIHALVDFAEFDIELGAEFVHGRSSEWYKVVKNSEATIFEDTNDLTFFRLDDNLKTEAQAAADVDAKKAFQFVNQIGTYTGSDKTVKAEADTRSIPTRVRHIVNAQIANERGTSYERISVLGIAEEDALWTSGNTDYKVTNTTFTKIIEKSFPDVLSKIVTDTPVKKIDYSAAKVKTTDSKGKIYESDYVIVTVPLPVLRDGDIAFSPGLPAKKEAATKKIGMGAGMKIILKFSTAFWPKDTGYIYGTGQVPLYWQTTLGRGVTPVLTAFVMGASAEQLSALGQGAVQAVLADLDAMYNGNASIKFVKAHIMDWSKEPFVRGAYSFPVVAGGMLMRERLAESLDKKVFFAGEATSLNGHNSTVHGAIESAIRAVDEILA